MAYYIASDKFGNYDLCHYGVKGMKWGIVNEDELVGNRIRSAGPKNNNISTRIRSSDAVKKYQNDGMKRTQQLKGGSTTQPSGISSKNVAAINKAAESMPTIPAASDQTAATKEEKTLANKIQDASAAYQTALMKMQMLARVCLANGISPTANADYLVARKEVIKAKYELDKLKNEQQQSAVNNPPTYAQQKQSMDSQAKEKLAEDKAKEKSGTDLDEIFKRQKRTLNSYGYKASGPKIGKSK